MLCIFEIISVSPLSQNFARFLNYWNKFRKFHGIPVVTDQPSLR